MTDQQTRPRPVRVVAVDRRDEDLLPAYGDVFRRFGLELRPVADLLEWTAQRPAPLIVLKVNETDDWRRLEQLARTSGSTVVALLARSAPSFYRRALLTGASGVAAATDAPAHVARVLQAALANYALLPVAAVREAGASARPVLSPANQALLGGLADGLTTEQLAERDGCSERTVYRRIRRLCASLQVRGRDEAVAVARRMGLLDPVRS